MVLTPAPFRETYSGTVQCPYQPEQPQFETEPKQGDQLLAGHQFGALLLRPTIKAARPRRECCLESFLLARRKTSEIRPNVAAVECLLGVTNSRLRRPRGASALPQQRTFPVGPKIGPRFAKVGHHPSFGQSQNWR